jgi:hypothetical protein
MSHKLVVSMALLPALAWGWNSYRSSNMQSNGGLWTVNQNGQSVAFTGTGLTITGSTGAGSAISTETIPAYAPSVDIAALVQTGGTCSGTYVLYTNASSNALLDPGSASQGTFTALVLNVTSGGTGCTGTLELKSKYGPAVASPSWSMSGIEHYQNNFYLQVVARNDMYYIYNWGRHLASVYAPQGFMAGTPGVGGWNMPGGASLTQVDLKSVEWGAPNAMNPADIAVSTTPTRVDFQFGGTTDSVWGGQSGTGMAYYMLYRNGGPVGELVSGFGQFADKGVSPGQTYSYMILAYDYHGNYTTVSFSATTPPAGSADPRRVGLSPTAATWGALGANVDLLSGNVNYNLPLLKAQARGGWGVTFALNHDTQTWKKEGSKVWKYGLDVGYGYGWRLLAGRVMRYFSGTGQTSHVVFTDSTGTEYRLDRMVNPDGTTSATATGYWAASTDPFYGIFHEDWNTYRMRFPDGSSWDFGSRSAGSEGDLGAAYPTRFSDSNGNLIIVRYAPGVGLPSFWTNSSARIDEIEDVRAKNMGSSWRTYKFTYDTSQPLHRLTAITNEIFSGEKYTFGYSAAQQLYEPFANTAWTGTNAASQRFLTSMTIEDTGGLNYAMTYPPLNTGEMTKIKIPYGGYARWDLAAITYNASRQVREVTAFVHAKDGTALTEKSYPLIHESNTSTLSQHAFTQLREPGGSPTAAKEWIFGNPVGVAGMVTQYKVYQLPTWEIKQWVDTFWGVDGYNKPYITGSRTYDDVGKSYQVEKRVEQTQDTWGNLTSMRVFNWGATGGTPRRQYTNTYLTTGPYASAYIRNRLLSSTMSENGGAAVTLVTNEYDNYGAGCAGGASCVITATSGARQKDAAYTTGYTLRGNLTSTSRYGDGSQSWNPTTWNWLFYDDTGSVVKTHDPRFVWGTAVPDASKNYAVVVFDGLERCLGVDFFDGREWRVLREWL